MRTLIVIVVAAILVMAGVLYWTVGSGSDDEAYVPEMTVVLYSRSTTTEVYDADMSLEVEEQGFLDHFFAASVAGDDFPAGEHLLEVQVFELPNVAADKYHRDTRKIVDKHWYIGDLYGEQESGMQEWTFTLKLPELTTEKTTETGAVYLLGTVRYGGKDIGLERWTVNPELMKVS